MQACHLHEKAKEGSARKDKSLSFETELSAYHSSAPNRAIGE
jgi:hypothetical protein